MASDADSSFFYATWRIKDKIIANRKKQILGYCNICDCPTWDIVYVPGVHDIAATASNSTTTHLLKLFDP